MPETQPLVTLKKKDFQTDNDVRWCPGCGDYAILATVQKYLATTGKKKEDFVFVSGIGCAARFPYYMNTYGFHTIHGRAPSIATGLKVAKPELDVWIISGDGDSLSIGGNHLLHILRRNLNVVILLFNNQIYGLTKGQYSPSSEQGKVTKSTPRGSIDHPVNPAAFALGAGASFYARTIDTHAKHMLEVLKAAHEHEGTALVEILQNCVVFNNAAFDDYASRTTRDERAVFCQPGQPLGFAKGERALDFRKGRFKAVAHEDATYVHEPSNAAAAYALAQLRYPVADAVPMGVLYQEQRATYDGLFVQDTKDAKSAGKEPTLHNLLHRGDVWEVK